MTFRSLSSFSLASALGLVLAFTGDPAFAQPGRERSADADKDEIVVMGQSLRGSVIGNVAPIVTLRAEDLAALGAATVGEVIDVLKGRTASMRSDDEAIVLLNGYRIPNMEVMNQLPREAIERVDILPEKVALSYGYPATRRVTNIVLRANFDQTNLSGALGGATEGGCCDREADGVTVHIRNSSILWAFASYEAKPRLLESQRDLVSLSSTSPFAIGGNIVGMGPGGDIDPRLDALTGSTVRIAAVPSGAAGQPPVLADFATGANRPNRTDARFARTLVPETGSLTMFAGYSGPLLGKWGWIGGGYTRTTSDSLVGLQPVALTLPSGNPFSPFQETVLLTRYGNTPLRQHSTTQAAQLNTGVTGLAIGSWSSMVNIHFEHNSTDFEIERGLDTVSLQAALLANDPAANPYGTLSGLGRRPNDTSRYVSDIGSIYTQTNGTLASIPAGKIAANITANIGINAIASRSTIASVQQSAKLSRRNLHLQAALQIPLTSRKENVLGWMGDTSANITTIVDHFSDFGIIRTLGGGLDWHPLEAVKLFASYQTQNVAPTLLDLGNPVSVTPNMPIYDYRTGLSADIDLISGGNRLLKAERKREIAFGASLKPFKKLPLELYSAYTMTRSANPVAQFPIASAEIEGAFPDRFVRDASGHLISIDGRPINFAQSRGNILRSGLSLNLKFGGTAIVPTPPEAAATAKPATPAPEATPPVTLFLTLDHKWRLRDEILIRDGLPSLDLLGGGAIDPGGGRSRHELEFQSATGYRGINFRLGGRWRAPTRAGAGYGAQAGSQLHFSSLMKVNANLSFDFDQLPAMTRDHPWLAKTFISLDIDNLFNARQHVRDANDETPLSYQPSYLDPLGRTIRLRIARKF